MKIQQVEDKAFSTYGRVLEGYALSPLLKAMEHTPLPKGEVIYVPGMEELEDLPVAKAFKDRAFGGLPIQVGFCNGFNTYLNAVEYHRSSEINVAVTDMILLVGRQQDITEEYTYDAKILGAYYQEQLEKQKNIEIQYCARIDRITKTEKSFVIYLEDGTEYETSFVLNASYASVNQILQKLENVGTEKFKIKYELCEIILCKPTEKLKPIGLTVMDGPFFSIMPFGCTGLHSLTSVTFTPHVTSYEELPTFSCQKGLESGENSCTPGHLGNCSECPHKPESAWMYMSQLANNT